MENNLPNSMERNELIMKIIQGGESNQVEFKSSLVAYLNSYGEIGYSRHIKFKIVKTIASFLNSNGGFLFIGLKDDMSVLGLESDFSLAQSKLDNPKDYFNLEIDKIISEYFKISATNISGEFLELENKLIYIIMKQLLYIFFMLCSTVLFGQENKSDFHISGFGGPFFQISSFLILFNTINSRLNMIALIKKFILSKIASIIGSGNMKQIETLITQEKPKFKKTKNTTSHKR